MIEKVEKIGKNPISLFTFSQILSILSMVKICWYIRIIKQEASKKLASKCLQRKLSSVTGSSIGDVTDIEVRGCARW